MRDQFFLIRQILLFWKEDQKMNRNKKVTILTECAVYVAMAAVLSTFTLFNMPFGGTVTPFATLPILVASLRHGSKWGIATALVFSLTQLLLGGMENIVAVPAKTLSAMMICAALDYVVPYTLLGFCGVIANRFKNAIAGITVSVLLTGLIRFVCSFLSGIIVWVAYTKEGWSVAGYSLAYNAVWCGPDVAITLVACLALSRVKALKIMPERHTANV